MKQNLIKAALISLGVNLLLFAFNLIMVQTSGVLPLARTYPGGDCSERIGFGVRLLTIFPETAAGQPGVSTHIGIDLFSLVIPLIMGFLIALIILQYHTAKK